MASITDGDAGSVMSLLHRQTLPQLLDPVEDNNDARRRRCGWLNGDLIRLDHDESLTVAGDIVVAIVPGLRGVSRVQELRGVACTQPSRE
jgi:hypothetical protein